jgi:hypothetical protein
MRFEKVDRALERPVLPRSNRFQCLGKLGRRRNELQTIITIQQEITIQVSVYKFFGKVCIK